MKIETRLTVLLGCGLLWACAPAREPSAPQPVARERPADSAESVQSTPGVQAQKPAPATLPSPSSMGAGRESEAKADQAEFADLAAAERALAEAKVELDQLALTSPVAQRGRSDAPAEKKGDKAAASAAGPTPAAATPPPAKARCEQTCRAFSSLSRAASAVCRLDGSSGAHCTRAKRVVLDSEQRVARCSCPASGN